MFVRARDRMFVVTLFSRHRRAFVSFGDRSGSAFVTVPIPFSSRRTAVRVPDWLSSHRARVDGVRSATRSIASAFGRTHATIAAVRDPSTQHLHVPTVEEHAFLEVVTRDPELHVQIATCLVDDYDPTGYCDVRVDDGPPLRGERPIDGPTLKRASMPPVDTMIWTNERGHLTSIEVVDYGDPSPNVYRDFIDAERLGTLRYPRRVPSVDGREGPTIT